MSSHMAAWRQDKNGKPHHCFSSFIGLDIPKSRCIRSPLVDFQNTTEDWLVKSIARGQRRRVLLCVTQYRCQPAVGILRYLPIQIVIEFTCVSMPQRIQS
jgi:hypothetical protein